MGLGFMKFVVRKIASGSYIGEATNVLDRLAKHTRNLEAGVSDYSQLQLDWNNLGSSEFEAFVLFIGPQ